jgi:hypothetical protein
MKVLKILVVLLLVVFSINAKNDKEKKDKEPKDKPAAVAMPEPAAIPELLVGLAGIACWMALRYRKNGPGYEERRRRA